MKTIRDNHQALHSVQPAVNGWAGGLLKTNNYKRCKYCNKVKKLNRFRWKYKVNGIIRTTPHIGHKCKQCQAITRGTKEFGKILVANEIFSKGLRTCTKCKNILSHTKFFKNKKHKGGYEHICKKCHGTKKIDGHKKEKNLF